ncbi:NAD-dependent epimerase/dehydratase family protein [Candidatus Solirubrobacter pratensis]|uniref:NAD-dependent epimerase/dehydratase family protein n=1 Tax=Candidatus Solirubrobacter pratensis TaxID=1298857 RepID=UPI000415B2FE|nr:NAD-dependent epimerase/dehydratase family protein [Candidatus Solirubrobacter pratensis]
MRSLVTGGAGFIGSHLVDALIARGDQVTVVDHLQRGNGHNLADARARGASVVRADVTEIATMLDAFRAARPQVVFHLAAQIDVRRSVEDPAADAYVNIGGTAAVLEAARDAGVERVLLASTAGVYGDPARIPTTEGEPVAPLSPYGTSKAAAESYLRLFSRLHGVSTLSLRMANVYGPRQDPHGEAGVVAIFCGAAAKGRRARLFGDGGQTRDFIYVGDVVEAFMTAGASTVEGELNVSTGRETTLLELASALGVRTETLPARAGEIRRSCLDPSAAGERFGWRARTAVDDGLARTLEWTLANERAPAPAS